MLYQPDDKLIKFADLEHNRTNVLQEFYAATEKVEIDSAEIKTLLKQIYNYPELALNTKFYILIKFKLKLRINEQDASLLSEIEEVAAFMQKVRDNYAYYRNVMSVEQFGLKLHDGSIEIQENVYAASEV